MINYKNLLKRDLPTTKEKPKVEETPSQDDSNRTDQKKTLDLRERKAKGDPTDKIQLAL